MTAVAAAPLLGAPIDGDDLPLHFYRIPILNDLWRSGIFYSRWIPDLIFGYGSPLFNFYPPLSAYLLTLLYWIMSANAPAAVAVFTLLTLALSSSGMYLASCKLYGKWGGILAAVAYTWSPFLLLQPYIRGSLSNGLALALFPWAVWSLFTLLERQNWRWVAITAVTIGAIFLSHAASSVLFIVPFVIFSLAAAALHSTERGHNAKLAGAAVVLGLALSAFFWLPAFGEIETTRYALEAGKVDYQDAFARVWQWPGKTFKGMSGAPIPKSAGLIQQAGGILTLIATAVTLWRANFNLRKNSTAALTFLCCVFGLGGIFLATSQSDWVWQIVTPLQGLQFPWRLLDLSVFWLSFGMGWAGFWLNRRFSSKTNTLAAFVLLSIMLANSAAVLSPPRTHLLPKRPSLTDVSSVQDQIGIYGLTAWGEYSASTVTRWPEPAHYDNKPLTPLADKLITPWPSLDILESTPWSIRLQTAVDEPRQLLLAVHDFPGWRLELDGQPLAYTTDAFGRITLPIPAGDHRVTFTFTATPIRQIGNVLSLLALTAFGFLLVQSQRPAAKSSPTTPVTEGPLKWSALGLLFLLGVKLIVLDYVNTPLVGQPTDQGLPGIPRPEHDDFGEVALIGAEQPHQGEIILYWRADQTPAEPYQVVLTLRDGRGVPVTQIVNPNPGFSVMSNWEAGQLVRDVYSLDVTELPAPTAVDIFVSLRRPAGDLLLLESQEDHTAVGPIGQVKIPPPDLVVEETATRLNANFNDQILLKGTTLPAAVEQPLLTFDLVWESQAAVPIDYTVFVHLLTLDGELVEQSDSQPLDGRYPTSAWEPGETIIETRQFVLDVPPGRYLLQVGMYELETGNRLPVSGDNAFGDRVIIGQISVSP